MSRFRAKIIKVILWIATASLASASGRADTVYLRDGRVLANVRVTPLDSVMRIQQNGAALRVPAGQVLRVVTGPVSEPPRPAALSKPEDSAPSRTLAFAADRPTTGAGQVVLHRNSDGEFFVYVPRMLRRPARLLVLVHGSVASGEPAAGRARDLIGGNDWIAMAEQEGVILAAPVFDRERFLRYQFLEGSKVSPDVFVLQIAADLADRFPDLDAKLFLYGHSAGGQFVHRFALTHPERVASAVVCAAGSYAFPDDSTPWPFGRLNSPNPSGFAQAATLPITVVVGERDSEPLPGEDLQKGGDRVNRARQWVEAMRGLAQSQGESPGVKLVAVSSLDHHSKALVAECTGYLFP